MNGHHGALCAIVRVPTVGAEALELLRFRRRTPGTPGGARSEQTRRSGRDARFLAHLAGLGKTAEPAGNPERLGDELAALEEAMKRTVAFERIEAEGVGELA